MQTAGVGATKDQRNSLYSISALTIAGRVAALVLIIATAAGPWFTDTHPATADTCAAPLIWLGDGRCACLVSLFSALGVAATPGQATMLWLCLLPLIPFFSTSLLLFVKEHRALWVGHLVVWGLAGAFSILLFIRIRFSYHIVWLWGAGLYGMLALAIITGEILVNRRQSK